jgi:hypothetical protein
MSPLEDLIPLGYQVARPPADAPVVDATAWRESDGSQFWVRPGDDEEAVVARVRNHVKLADKMEQAQTYFADNFANWGTMTAAQKDAANRQAQRALSNLCRYVRNDLSSEGS